MAAMILAADVGGSKTLVGLFGVEAPRPRLVDARTVRTLDFDGLPALLDAYLAGHRGVAVDRVGLGVAGPILHDEATMTNVPWRVRRREVAAVTGAADVRLLNDLEAMAHAVPVLTADELHTLRAGRARRRRQRRADRRRHRARRSDPAPRRRPHGAGAVGSRAQRFRRPHRRRGRRCSISCAPVSAVSTSST